MTDPNFNNLSFSQREGKAPLPDPMRLQYLPIDFRNRVWRVMDDWIDRGRDLRYPRTSYEELAVMRQLVIEYAVSILHRPHDFMKHNPNEHRAFLRKIVLDGKYDQVLSLVEFVIRSSIPPELGVALVQAFEVVPIAYSVETVSDRPTIVPRFSKESGAATKQAIKEIENHGPEGAKAHLLNATEAINHNRYADAVRDSIHCVESVARTIDPKAQTKLSHALKSLENAGVLKHNALKVAFEKLYGYTSDEEGIRHSLLEEGSPDVDLEDAVFMFAACAAFSSYLVKRHQQVKDGT